MKFFLALSSLLLASAVNANGDMGECTAIPQNRLKQGSWATNNNDCKQCDVTKLGLSYPCNKSPRICEGTCWFVGEPLPPHPPSSEIEGCVPKQKARLASGEHPPANNQCNKCANGYKYWPCDLDPPTCEGMECQGSVFEKVHAAEQAAAEQADATGPDNAALEAALADVCKANAWGDPHMVTFDGLKFDAQPKGEATFLTSENPKLEIQGRLEKANHGRGDPSVTTGIAIEGPGDSPRIQVSIAQPEFVSLAGFGVKQDGFCVRWNGSDQNSGVVLLDNKSYADKNAEHYGYIDEGDRHKECLEMCATVVGVTGCEMIWDQNNHGCYAHKADVTGGGNGVGRHSCYLVENEAELGTCSGYQEIQLGSISCAVEMMVNGKKQEMIAYDDPLANVEQNGQWITIEYPGVVKVEMKLSHFGRCFFSVNVELYDCGSYATSAIGLLGSPNNNSRDDWMDRDGDVLTIPGGAGKMFFEPAFDYVKNNWIINDADDTIFTYDNCASFDTIAVPDEEYDEEMEELVDDADPEIRNICGDDIQCIIDGATLGADAAEDFIKNPAKDRIPAEGTTDPTASPTNGPTASSTGTPTKSPTASPTNGPTASPTGHPTKSPTASPTNGPTASPTVSPTKATELVKLEDDDTTTDNKGPSSGPASGSGDPHFKTWTGDKYDYHGECDLVLVDHPAFANDLGLKIHIRTERVKYFSFISNIAVQIGDDVLEFDNDVDNFMINGEKVPPQRKHVKTLLGGFHVRRDPKAISIRFDKHIKSKIDLIQRKNGWPAVVVDGAETEIFKGSLGLLGDWENGKRLARDGMTEMNDPDATNFALEWQVRDTEPMLFKEARFPQYPRTCTPPTKNLSKRLGVSNFEKEAQKACAHWKQDIEDCIFDVIATRDIMVAEEGHVGASVA